MSILPVACPECGAKLSSKAGFAAGQKIKCPKCEEVFAVPAAKRKPPVELEIDDDEEPRPAKKKKKPVVDEDDEDDEPRPVKKKKRAEDEDDEEYERPRKKKKKGKKSDDEESYANSPLRFIVLGVLLVVMAVLGYFLVKKINAPPQEIVVPAKPVPGED